MSMQMAVDFLELLELCMAYYVYGWQHATLRRTFKGVRNLGL